MPMNRPFRRLPLDGGLVLEFFDLGNRYYGDYHRVKVLVRCEIRLQQRLFSADKDPEKALGRAKRWLGESVCFEKSLERMGVSGADVDSVRQQLIDAFLATAGRYLRHPQFPQRLIASRLQARQSRPVPVPQR